MRLCAVQQTHIDKQKIKRDANYRYMQSTLHGKLTVQIEFAGEMISTKMRVKDVISAWVDDGCVADDCMRLQYVWMVSNDRIHT